MGVLRLFTLSSFRLPVHVGCGAECALVRTCTAGVVLCVLARQVYCVCTCTSVRCGNMHVRCSRPHSLHQPRALSSCSHFCCGTSESRVTQVRTDAENRRIFHKPSCVCIDCERFVGHPAAVCLHLDWSGRRPLELASVPKRPTQTTSLYLFVRLEDAASVRCRCRMGTRKSTQLKAGTCGKA
jgi:hypothetical protein